MRHDDVVQLQVAANQVEAGVQFDLVHAGTWEVSSITVDRCRSVKFDTPIGRTCPCGMGAPSSRAAGGVGSQNAWGATIMPSRGQTMT
jgi:hypothetical protein